ETVEQAAQRICCDETGLQPRSIKYVTTVQEFVKENNNKKYHFVMLLFRIRAEGRLKNGRMFSLENLPKKTVPSDIHMLQITKSNLATSVIEENRAHLKQETFS
ncbi:MAG: NUDIX hydrolase, partial [archaeon]